MTNSCANCLYFKPLPSVGTHAGSCRAHPPQRLNPDEFKSAYPPTNKDEWCGEWMMKLELAPVPVPAKKKTVES